MQWLMAALLVTATEQKQLCVRSTHVACLCYRIPFSFEERMEGAVMSLTDMVLSGSQTRVGKSTGLGVD